MMPNAPDNPTPGSSGLDSDTAQAAANAANAALSPQPAKPTRSLNLLVFGSFVLAVVSAMLSATALLFAAGILPPIRDAPMLDELEQTDKALRLVFKEYPILGPGSIFAARAALASQKQGKYLAFHKAMMTYKGQITENSSLEVAAQVGLDVERLKKDMEDPAIDEAIQRNRALAGVLRISGTPTFIAGKEILRGLVDGGTMKQLIASVRGR